MSDYYKKFEATCKKITKQNAILLNDFRVWLIAKGLGKETVGRHVGNAGFYIDHYLLYADAIPAAGGAKEIAGFLGAWFIRKALWANKSSIRANAASLKKFYTFMVERGETDPEDLAILQQAIEEEMDEWLSELRRFDSLADASF